MSASAGFNIEDIFTPVREGRPGGGDMEEPKVEQLMVKLKVLQQVKRALEEDVKKAQLVKDSLQEELVTLHAEPYQVEGIHKEKEESCKVLQFQCEEAEQDSARQLQLNKRNEELLEHYRCQIQEFKLKHRKQRMKFENQLHQLIEQHKNLHSVFTLQRLPAEIENADNAKSQLIAAEQLKLSQLRHLEEDVEEVRRQKQLEVAAVETQEE